MNIGQLHADIIAKKISPVELVEDALAKVEADNQKYNAFVTVAREQALEAASAAEREILRGDVRGFLHGIPIGIKDIIYTDEMRTTMGSAVYQDFVPQEDALVVARLKAAGAIILGKLHTHEFAYGPTGDRSFCGPARNPHDPARVTGGSSSGAAAAVALDWIAAGVGTDTGGSIRIPAACCGVVGLKPTYDLIARTGVYPLSASLDHVGPLAQSVSDCAHMLAAMVRSDETNTDSKFHFTDQYRQTLYDGVSELRIGVPRQYFWDMLEPEIRQRNTWVIEQLEGQGAVIVPVDLTHITQFVSAHQAIQRSEAYTVHTVHIRDFAAVMDAELLDRLNLSMKVFGYEYVQAKSFQQEAKRMVDELWANVDCILTPTLPIFAPYIDERDIIVDEKQTTVRDALLRCTSPFNLTGHPALSVPCGRGQAGLPMAVQVVGPMYNEARLFQIGFAIEQMTMV
ncbi:amidase [Alicyclobacillus fodiniaquatilis]|uniref:Amidase n=1 Tax=Alicyclobacillus fodiniaquatilis TaxID=1661150 RepID=A0ABW4JG92_9BACL